jgi:tetratricopeptide (TPR) repeat protein
MRERPVVEVLEYALGYEPGQQFLAGNSSAKSLVVGMWNRLLFGPSQFKKSDRAPSQNEGNTPLEWALALGLSSLFTTESFPRFHYVGDFFKERLSLALKNYREAVQNRLSEIAPEKWAEIEINLGKALYFIGTAYNDLDFVRRSEKLFRFGVSDAVSAAQRGGSFGLLACSLHFLGERQNTNEGLAEAISAYREALELSGSSQVELKRASLFMNLGAALEALGIRQGNDELLREAASTLRLALAEISEISVQESDVADHESVGLFYKRVGLRAAILSKLANVLLVSHMGSERVAIATYRKALAEFDRFRNTDDSPVSSSLTDDQVLELIRRDPTLNYIPRIWDREDV